MLRENAAYPRAKCDASPQNDFGASLLLSNFLNKDVYQGGTRERRRACNRDMPGYARAYGDLQALPVALDARGRRPVDVTRRGTREPMAKELDDMPEYARTDGDLST